MPKRATPTGLPNSIRVGPFDFTVREWTHQEGYSRGRYGEMSTVDFTISVDQTTAPVKLVDTILHEIGHAIYWAYGIEDGDQEERLVGTLATAWTQVWRDNPSLLHWVGATLGRADE